MRQNATADRMIRRPARELIGVAAVAILLLSLSSTTSALASTNSSARAPRTTFAPNNLGRVPSPLARYPDGKANSKEPSGFGPPADNALAGYVRTYVTDFSGSSLPRGWSTFAGQPGNDPGALWAGNQVSVSDGLLQLKTSQNPSRGGTWVSGGVSQNFGKTYGAYFVRSRTTGPGPTVVQLLWPQRSDWPPEIDFDETYGKTTATSATVHWGATNQQSQRQLSINMTKWHTWGVIWTPTSITYTVDGRVWGQVTVPSAIPNQPMTLDLDQQTWCSSGYACPTSPQAELVDWVAEYTAA